jgi:hypothetical protein
MVYESDPRVEAMHQHYEEGATLEEVGERFGFSSTEVALFFKKAGLGMRLSDRPSAIYESDPRAEAMYEFYREGASLEQVGRRFSLSSAQVGLFFERAGQTTPRTPEHRSVAAGEPLRHGALRHLTGPVDSLSDHPGSSQDVATGQSSRLTDRTAEMYRLYESGATLEEVAQRYALTRERVRLIFQRAPFKRHSDPTDAQFREMYELFSAGAGAQELSEQYGFSASRLAKMFATETYRRRGIEIVESFQASKDATAVAVALGIPSKVVLEILYEQLPEDEHHTIARGAARR